MTRPLGCRLPTLLLLLLLLQLSAATSNNVIPSFIPISPFIRKQFAKKQQQRPNPLCRTQIQHRSYNNNSNNKEKRQQQHRQQRKIVPDSAASVLRLQATSHCVQLVSVPLSPRPVSTVPYHRAGHNAFAYAVCNMHSRRQHLLQA